MQNFPTMPEAKHEENDFYYVALSENITSNWESSPQECYFDTLSEVKRKTSELISRCQVVRISDTEGFNNQGIYIVINK